MPVEIKMPELGESVHEGTVSRWLKKEGDFVKEDEPVVEIMTDKVNTELVAPATGILAKILVQEGGAVEVFAAMGLIDDSAGAATPASAPAAEAAPVPAAPTAAPATPATVPAPAAASSEGDRKWYTPVVRAMMKEHGISEEEIQGLTGTGEGGRVAKRDVEAYLASGRKVASQIIEATPTKVAVPAATVPQPKAAPQPTVAGPEQELVPLAGMRKMIADAMIRSSQVPTVSTVTQVDVTSMVKFREINKDSFLETYGVKLTYTPFFIKALAEALTEFPLVNSSLREDNMIVMNKGVHIGVAVALGKGGEGGLIVPVIRDCHKKNLIDIARDLDAIAQKARANKLGVADVQGGTFTLTNPGTYGALFGTPMINAPQAGILGTYSISKEPVIVDDMIAIRSIMHLVLTYDHRLVDGMLAGKFLAAIRDKLHGFDFFK
ncbi:dihydrolipoamide acetyltransferase family protein [Fimbriimonas ginsengisoli]|uniref:Dihydrolipoamide acetyltransferase component of pyruvate dehydrogenase complex n=1 Tax=Fimbriimonas ginsengisoli Gsoil 348 TaxID=661478 RepID=A0A068NVD4_FIMGI|nr:dihydrolipoamide acetyltransferase family protein [Fimbriimonas ginsengisoli]AIE87483.1 catalytic domain of dehydrogenase complexe [Fimbriimonas ginsengisoli Gsoil 348]